MTTPPDPSPRNRILWGVVCWFHTALLIGFGASFATFGLGATATPRSYEVFVRFVPGQMHTYGVVMLLFASLMLYGLLAPLYRRPMLDRWLRNALFVICGYDLLLGWLFGWSWVLSHSNTWLSVFTWFCLAGLAAAAGILAPLASDRPGRAA